MHRSSSFFLAAVGSFVIGCTFFVSGCGNQGGSSSKGSHLIKHLAINYAHGFQVDYYQGYRELTIENKMAGQADTLHYLLVDSGVAAPTDRPGIPVITTPMRQFAVQSSVPVAVWGFAGV